MDQTYMGSHSMFRTFNFKDGNALTTPVYYVNNATEEVVAEETWECGYIHKEEATGVESGMVIHN